MEDNKSYISNQSNLSIRTTYVRKNRKNSSQDNSDINKSNNNNNYYYPDYSNNNNNNNNYPYSRRNFFNSNPYRNPCLYSNQSPNKNKEEEESTNEKETQTHHRNRIQRNIINNPHQEETKSNPSTNYPNTKRVIDSSYQEEDPKSHKNKNYPQGGGVWDSMMSRTSGEESLCSRNKKISNSKTFQSNVFPTENFGPEEVKHFKETKFSDQLHKTQITTLPGGVKRGKYEIKDDAKFGVRNTESYLYKMTHDYNCNVNFDKKENEEGDDEEKYNEFPTEKRYQGSYHRGVKDNDIFGTNENNNNKNNYDYNRNNYNYSHKKIFSDNQTFKSQIDFS